IGDARVAMVLEPDLGITRKDGIWRPRVRWRMTRYAAEVFGALENTHVYLDASSADWLRVDVARDMLLASGIRHVRGFALGATH
ncbi:glycoside hydrolase family 6 protein, partial [Klebsiella pneumoniae]|nr:glycoside hydrolase family 6 protein [Klebsiella pneumoniae]